MKRKICVVTGSRSEYGILRRLIKQIKEEKKFELMIVVTGMHLLSMFGKTIDIIKKDGFRSYHVIPMQCEKDDSEAGMAISISKGIEGMVKVFKKEMPDIVLVLGDRTEALAGSIAASYMNIPVAHIHGGDNARAGLDDLARGAITKLSHIHFPATKKSMERILKMGEAKWRVFLVGSPAIDQIRSERVIGKKEVYEKLEIPQDKEIILVVQHSVSTAPDDAALQIKETLEALRENKEQIILIYPNSDAGGRRMIDVIKQYEKKMPNLKTFKNLDRTDYLSLMKRAQVLVGNSSSGIIDTPSFKLPVVNIGIRQEGRERACNIIDVPHKRKGISRAIKKAMSKKFKEKMKRCKSPYGDGRASERIVKVLREIELGKKLLQKRMMEE